MEGIRGQLHPLQNLDILEQVFKKFHLYQLMRCRVVCRAWRQASTQRMQSCAQITFRNPDEWKDSNAPEEKSISNFLQLIANEESTFHSAPFTNTFKFKKGIMGRPPFWKKCGHAIKSLTFEKITFPSADVVRHILFRRCPNLEMVAFDCVKVIGSENFQRPADFAWVEPDCQNRKLKTLVFRSQKETDLGLSWIEIFSHFPALEDLYFRDVFDGREFVFRSLAAVRQHDGESWNLKKLAIKFCWKSEDSEETMEMLLNGNLKLEELKVDFMESSQNAKNVRKVITAHAPTLKALYISADKFSNPYALPMPRNTLFENLTDFSFLSENPNIKLHIFLACLPNLKRLTLSLVEDQRLARNLVLPKCTDFVAGDKSSISTEHIQRLKGWLPNLEMLVMGKLDNETFEKVCEAWPNLRYFNLPRCRVDDAGISGFDKEDVDKINQGGKEGHWRPITVPRANLASLKYLEHFSWNADEAGEVLGHCSELYGIQPLAHLKCKDIPRLPDPMTLRILWILKFLKRYFRLPITFE